MAEMKTTMSDLVREFIEREARAASPVANLKMPASPVANLKMPARFGPRYYDPVLDKLQVWPAPGLDIRSPHGAHATFTAEYQVRNSMELFPELHAELRQMQDAIARDFEQALGFSSRTALVVVDRPAAIPSILPPTLPPQEYFDLAERIRLRSPALVRARFEIFLSTEGWPVYPYEKVMSYLHYIAKRDRASDTAPELVPYWAPLRWEDADAEMLEPPQNSWQQKGQARPYRRSVPMHALEKVEVLESRFGTGVLKFFVSDYAAVNPDPFLLVKAGDGLFVVDVWDEPGW